MSSNYEHEMSLMLRVVRAQGLPSRGVHLDWDIDLNARQAIGKYGFKSRWASTFWNSFQQFRIDSTSSFKISYNLIYINAIFTSKKVISMFFNTWTTIRAISKCAHLPLTFSLFYVYVVLKRSHYTRNFRCTWFYCSTNWNDLRINGSWVTEIKDNENGNIVSLIEYTWFLYDKNNNVLFKMTEDVPSKTMTLKQIKNNKTVDPDEVVM